MERSAGSERGFADDAAIFCDRISVTLEVRWRVKIQVVWRKPTASTLLPAERVHGGPAVRIADDGADCIHVARVAGGEAGGGKRRGTRAAEHSIGPGQWHRPIAVTAHVTRGIQGVCKRVRSSERTSTRIENAQVFPQSGRVPKRDAVTASILIVAIRLAGHAAQRIHAFDAGQTVVA